MNIILSYLAPSLLALWLIFGLCIVFGNKSSERPSDWRENVVVALVLPIALVCVWLDDKELV